MGAVSVELLAVSEVLPKRDAHTTSSREQHCWVSERSDIDTGTVPINLTSLRVATGDLRISTSALLLSIGAGSVGPPKGSSRPPSRAEPPTRCDRVSPDRRTTNVGSASNEDAQTARHTGTALLP